MLVSNILTNLELSVENVAVRVVTKEAISHQEKVSTFLIRTHAITFSINKIATDNPTILQPSDQEKKHIDPLLPMSDLQCLLGNKKFAVSDISIHLMKDKWLDPMEHCKPGQFSTHYNALSFPMDYPPLNHPAAIFLLKAPIGIKELSKNSTASSLVHLREGYEFVPSIAV